MIILLTPCQKIKIKNLMDALYIYSIRFVVEKGNDVNKV
jgi:hypothetical protein